MHHECPIRHTEHFLHFAGDKENSHSFPGKFFHQPVNLALGPHINTAGGFIQHEQLRGKGEPLAKHDFLLVAAGKKTGYLLEMGRLDLELFDGFLGNGLLGGKVQDPLILIAL